MAKQRILILAPDPGSIALKVRQSSFADIPVKVRSDWEKGVSVLAKENFSVIVARKLSNRQSAEEFVRGILQLAPKTPVVLVLPKKGGPSVLGALRGGASEILFEEDLDTELVSTLEKYLFQGYGLLRKTSLDELFESNRRWAAETGRA